MSTLNTEIPDQVDVRGPRFAAWVTTVALIAAFGICLGCRLYPLVALAFPRTQSPSNRKEFAHGTF